MARKLRVEYPGAICHVMNRGDRCEPIFVDDADWHSRRRIETLGEACAKAGWQVHAYVLLPNHFQQSEQALEERQGVEETKRRNGSSRRS